MLMKRGKYKKWTNDEELVIISMRAEGKSIKEIANALNRTYPSTQHFVKKLIDECKIAKRANTSKVNASELLEFIARNPGNIQRAFRQYSEKTGLSIGTIHSVYYGKYKNKKSIKESSTVFTVISKYGHTLRNGKNTPEIKRSKLWSKMKEWLFASLLS